MRYEIVSLPRRDRKLPGLVLQRQRRRSELQRFWKGYGSLYRDWRARRESERTS